MNLEGYVACICEGSAEQAIMEILIKEDKLIFEEDKLLDGEIIRSRSAKFFEKTYLRKGFKDKITVLRILDSRKEQFKLSPAYVDKVDVIDIITAPEIEMLIILNEDKYDEFKKSGMKPSEFCKVKMKYHSVKTYQFVRDYFSDVSQLIASIEEYKRISKIRKGEYTLSDLINK
jgi:hypothetical protein